LAKDLGTSLPKLAIAWCAKNENVSTVILGASKLSQLEETLTSLEVIPKITEEVNLQIEGYLNNQPKKPVF
jgi:aryl-alcohol dehydrogenase-like predicted oxidoreductase